jgi:starch synthase (maltosyl-transferring)
LGSIDDFDALVVAARERDIDIALDLAYQTSPDHPWVEQHRDWFKTRPDGSIQYAENPPKKYQDAYPLDFESDAWQALWHELRSVVRFWMDHGVRIFRVDNPHTKPFDFWEWLIADIRASDPDVIFLAEAFTRPKVMYRLAKLGFSQSYTYFTWRNDKPALTDYFTEITRAPINHYFRANLFTNTPDILHAYLQEGGRSAFQVRAVLAATLGATWGIYGPPFEQLENTPLEPGSEEYLDSEKYQLRHWDLERADTIAPLIRQLNTLRREHAALQSDERLRFLDIDDDAIVAYAKRSADGADVVVAVVNLDNTAARGGRVRLPLDELGLGWNGYDAHELLTDRHEQRHVDHLDVHLDPNVLPAAVFHLSARPEAQG